MRLSVRVLATLPALAVLCAGTAATAATAAGAAATTTVKPAAQPNPQVQNFCSQVRASQSSIASLTGTTAEKNARIGIEWTKIEKVAPPTIKSQVTLIKAAYVKASTQPDATAKATVATIAAAGQKVTTFVGSNCGGAGGGGQRDGGPGGPDGPGRLDPARLAEVQACFKKEGVTFTAGDRPNFDDPKFQAAAAKCGLAFGRGGPGGRGISDAVRKCLADKGVTLPTRPANATPPTGQPGGAAGGQRPAGVGGQLDDKARAALEACRAANP